MNSEKNTRPAGEGECRCGEVAREAMEAIRQMAEATKQVAEAAKSAAEATTQAVHVARQAIQAMQQMAAAGASAAGPSGDIPVVIAAAVAAYLKDQPFQITRIRLASQPSLAWSHSGRAGIHSSHLTKKRN